MLNDYFEFSGDREFVNELLPAARKAAEEAAKKAQDEFINVVQNKGIPEDIEEVKLDSPIGILDLIVKLNFTPSKGEAKRLIQQGGVSIDDKKVESFDLKISRAELQKGIKIKKGKEQKICKISNKKANTVTDTGEI